MGWRREAKRTRVSRYQNFFASSPHISLLQGLRGAQQSSSSTDQQEETRERNHLMSDQSTEVRGGTAADLTRAWAGDPRWLGVKRSYTAQDVVKLRGTV